MIFWVLRSMSSFYHSLSLHISIWSSLLEDLSSRLNYVCFCVCLDAWFLHPFFFLSFYLQFWEIWESLYLHHKLSLIIWCLSDWEVADKNLNIVKEFVQIWLLWNGHKKPLNWELKFDFCKLSLKFIYWFCYFHNFWLVVV